MTLKPNTHKHNSSEFDAEHVGRLFSSEEMYSASQPELQFGLLDSKLKLEVVQSPSPAAIKYACEPSHKYVAYKLSGPDHLSSADPFPDGVKTAEVASVAPLLHQPLIKTITSKHTLILLCYNDQSPANFCHVWLILHRLSHPHFQKGPFFLILKNI